MDDTIKKAEDFLIRKLKPKSESLKTGVINLDAVPKLISDFIDEQKTLKKIKKEAK